jgi:hypothetical protein
MSGKIHIDYTVVLWSILTVSTYKIPCLIGHVCTFPELQCTEHYFLCTLCTLYSIRGPLFGTTSVLVRYRSRPTEADLIRNTYSTGAIKSSIVRLRVSVRGVQYSVTPRPTTHDPP